MKRLILQNLCKRKAQVISMAATIAICAMVFVSLFLLYGGMQRGVTLNEERGGADILVVPMDAYSYVTDKEMLFTGAPVSSYMSADKVEQIAQIDGVKRVTVQFYGQTLPSECCSTGFESRIVGIDLATDWVVTPYSPVKISSLADNEIISGAKTGLKLGGTLRVLGRDVTCVSVLEETGTMLDYSMLMDIDALRTLCASNENFSQFLEGQDPSQLVSTVLVELENENKIDYISMQIRKVGDVAVIKRASVVADSQETLSTVFTIMLAAGILLGIASLLQFVARYSSSVWERKAELALYRALGATQGTLRTTICGEAFVITGIGSVIGAALGIGLYYGAYSYLQKMDAFPFSALPWWLAVLGIILVIALFFVIALISILAPMRQLGKIDPSSAMQQVDIG